MQNILGIAAVLAIGPLVMLAAEAENKTAVTPRDVNSVELRRSEWKFGTAWKMVPGLGRKGGEALVCEKTPEVQGGGIEVKVGKGVSLKGKELVVDMQGLDYAFLRLDPK